MIPHGTQPVQQSEPPPKAAPPPQRTSARVRETKKRKQEEMAQQVRAAPEVRLHECRCFTPRIDVAFAGPHALQIEAACRDVHARPPGLL